MNRKVKKADNRIKGCMSDKIFDMVNVTILGIILLVTAYPILIVISSSISSSQALLSGKVWLLPVDISFAGYEVVVKNKDVLNQYEFNRKDFGELIKENKVMNIIELGK